jgi:hypothetical protein
MMAEVGRRWFSSFLWFLSCMGGVGVGKFKNPGKLECCFFYSTNDSHEGNRVKRSLFYSSET